MKLFKYNIFSLMIIFIWLVSATNAYAIPSAPTPGPSVGHRPIVTDLVIGARSAGGAQADITLPSTSLVPGDFLYLARASGGPNAADIDGDLDKIGAHCVWYKVHTDGTSTVAQDPGPNDRICQYTIQTSDIGFKIKNVIRIFSDQDVATQKGYTLNPIDSLPVETVSAAVVGQSILPFQYKGLYESKYGYVDVGSMAQFKTMIKDGTFMLGNSMDSSGYVESMGADFVWTSSDPSSLQVSDGLITVKDLPAGPVIIRAENTSSGITYEYTVLRPKQWFTDEIWRPSVIFPPIAGSEAVNACLSKGARMPSSSELLVESIEGAINSSLVNEWSYGEVGPQKAKAFKSRTYVTSDSNFANQIVKIVSENYITESRFYPLAHNNSNSLMCVNDL